MLTRVSFLQSVACGTLTAHIISWVGLLPKDNFEQVPFAYKMYARTDKDAETQSAAFKQAFSRPVEVEFLGVW